MTPVDLAILGVAALLTSALTAVAGLGGGIILLALLLLYLDPIVAIPVHGAIQLISNASRTWIQRRHVERRLVGRFAILLVPGTILGVALLNAIPSSVGRVAIGVFALVATWRPQWFRLGVGLGVGSGGALPEGAAQPERRFLALGGVIGVASATLGASGPLMAPFLRDLGLARQGVIATFAACQSLAHATKIAVFGLAGFAFATHAPLLVVGAAGVLLGTWAGSRLLDAMSEATFQWIYRTALTLIALRLILVDGAALLSPLAQPRLITLRITQGDGSTDLHGMLLAVRVGRAFSAWWRCRHPLRSRCR